MMTNIVELPADARGAAARHAARGRVRRTSATTITLPLFEPAESAPMKPKSVAIVGAAETTELGKIPDMLAAPAARRRRAQRAGRRGPQAARHRRRRHRRRVADRARALPRHHADVGRRHQRRRLLVHAARAPRRRGDQRGPVQDRADHARRERQVAASARRLPRRRRAASLRASSRCPYGADGPADAVHASRCCAT